MSLKTEPDTGVELEFLFEMESASSSREDIHLMCHSPRNNDQHVVCGAGDSGDIVPDWVEINCADCLKVEEPALRGDWARCRVCGHEFSYEDED